MHRLLPLSILLVGCPRSLTRTAEVFVQEATLPGSANGLYVDADDRLYVARGGAERISILDPDSGAVLDELTADDGVAIPDDLVVDADGTVYWTEGLVGEVRALATDGSRWVAAEGVFGANPVAIADDGTLYVAQCFGPSGGVFALGGDGPETLVDGVPGCASNAMDWHEGVLYTTRWFEDRVVRLDPATGEQTDVLTGFATPTAAKVGPDGALYVVSQQTGLVVRVDLQTSETQIVAELEPGLDNLAFDSSGRLFVSSAADASIVEVLGDGAVRVVVAGGLNTPMGLAVFDGALWVGEPMAVRGYALADGAPRGVLRHTIGRGPFPGTPMNVAAAGDRLLMTDPFGGAAAFYTPDTGDIVPLTPFGAPVDAEPFVDGFAVSDFATGTVWLARGEALDDRVPVAEGLAPTGLAADGGDLYVGDAATGQVWRVAHHGVPLETPEPLPWSGTTPEGMVVVEGVLYVLDGGTGEVSGLHLDTGRSWSVAIGLGVGPAVDGFPPFKFFNDLVADEAGRLYASGDAAGVVYRL